jgi:glutathione synthase/RimK-type ligase-like ATP-grasp enzyme
MILLCGIPSEGPLARVRAELDDLGVPYAIFHQRRFAEMDMGFSISDGGVAGWLRIGRACHRLEDFTGVYTRLMDDGSLPELRDEPHESPRRTACRALHATLARWSEVAPARVLNRAGPMSTNASKPLQAQLIRRHGFAIPDTLITSDPSAVRGFRSRHGRVIYKSISGVRSVVRTLDDDDLDRLDLIRWCPTQFQRHVPGTNVRVHVVGGDVFATRIRSAATDYRYAQREGHEPAELEAMDLDDGLAARCVALAGDLGLPFAGLDLKVAPEAETVCFEVNPSPAFSYYEAHTGQPIARAVARHLAALD